MDADYFLRENNSIPSFKYFYVTAKEKYYKLREKNDGLKPTNKIDLPRSFNEFLFKKN